MSLSPVIQSLAISAQSVTDPDQGGSGVLKIHEFSRPERMRRALRAGAITIGIAIACVFIPGLHFILVPTALLASPFVAIHFFGVESLIVGSQINCPKCTKPLDVSRIKPQWPVREVCLSCRSEILLNPKA